MQSEIEELVKRSLEDQSYTLYLWEKMKPLCLKWAHKLGHIEGDREDLYQESYILLIRALRCYEVCQNMSFEAYFKMVYIARTIFTVSAIKKLTLAIN